MDLSENDLSENDPVKQPHNSIAGDWLCDAGGELLFDLLPDSLGLLAVSPPPT